MIKDRFLLGIFIGIGVLVLAALILFFTRQGQTGYVGDSTPEGVLRNYILSIQKRDYQRAYSYLADQQRKPDQYHFQQLFLDSQQGTYAARSAVEFNVTQLDETGQTAVIEFTVLRGSQDLFGSVEKSRKSARLVRQNGAWKIASAPYPYSFPESALPLPTRPVIPTSTPIPTVPPL